MSQEDPGFKVVDRRSSSSSSSDEESSPRAEEKKGPGFVMSEKDEPEAGVLQVDFSTLVLSFATSAMINLGQAPDPSTGRVEANLELARQNIDILDILRTKTAGNLSEDESKLLETLLTELRMAFVRLHAGK